MLTITKHLFVLMVMFFLSFIPNSSHGGVLFSEDFSSGSFGKFSPMIVNDPSDSCDAAGDVFVDTTDHRPGSKDNYAYHIVPGKGDVGTCCHGKETFSIGQGQELYFAFWQKYGPKNLWDTGAGKGPEVYGGNPNRIVVGPAWFTEEQWSIPDPANCTSGFKCATIPSIINFNNSNNGWRPVNSCDGTLWSQNIDTGKPVYIERGYWYKFKLYVYAHTTQGRMRLWVQREDWPAEREILDTQRSGCSGVRTLSSESAKYTVINPHYMFNDHGGAGANADFEIWLDDVVVTSENATETIPAPAAPSAPSSLRIVQ